MWDWRVRLHKNGKWKIFYFGGVWEKKNFPEEREKKWGVYIEGLVTFSVGG